MKDSSTGSRVINEVVLGEEVLAGLTENVRQFLLKTSVLRTMTGPLYDAVTGGEGSVSCPAGDTTTDYRMARDGWYRPVKLFRFPREACNECDLKELCLGGPNDRANNPVRLPPGRQLQMHYHEEVLQRARSEQRMAEQKKALRKKLRPRAKVERKIYETHRNVTPEV